MTKLYIVATPIGNLADITIRAIDTLKSVDFVAAEDTRKAKILFNKYEINTHLVSYHVQSSPHKVNEIIQKIKQGQSCALISEAGTPCISDPGFRMVQMATIEGIKVIPIPGASAIITFVSACGVPSDKFIFLGFLPHKKGRQTLLKSMKDSVYPHIFYESVHRFNKLINELSDYIGSDCKIVVGRELTKIHEEFFRGTVSEAKEYFTDDNTKGEFVVLVAPK